MENRHALRRTSAHAPAAVPRALSEVVVEERRFRDDGVVPNNPTLPVLLLPGLLQPLADSAAVMALFETNGWVRVWCWEVFPWQHYHPNAHEVLAVVSGWADLILGGPSGDIVRVVAGDALVLPAGTGHCQLDARSDFRVCGGYPRGQEGREIVRGILAARVNAVERVAAVPLPESDPFYGAEGPVTARWRG